MRALDWISPAAAALGLAALTATFAVERGAFRKSVVGWAERDLDVRTQLAASTLREPLETSDFRRIHEIGGECEADGVRLTVFSGSGGVFFDSHRRGTDEPKSIYATVPCGDFRVRLGLPEERVLAPFRRAGKGFLLAALAGGAGVLLVFFFSYRQGVRIRELARLEKFRREFIADVSHEIKTPLTGIMGAVDLLDDCPDDQRGRLLEMVKGESARLNALAQSVLDLARLERTDGMLVRARSDLAALAQETVERLAPKAAKAGVALRLECGGEDVVDCDASLVSQALSNLVENAIRHSGSPEVVVRVDGPRLVVEDHGRGIPPEHAKRVFERFHRVDPSRAAETGGAGLGLAIVRQIAHLHGGEVSLENVAPHGCRFVLSLG